MTNRVLHLCAALAIAVSHGGGARLAHPGEPLAPPPPVRAEAPWREYQGCIHAHSTYSDGSGTFEHIASDAVKAGVDFVIMTDHTTLKPLADGKQKWYGSEGGPWAPQGAANPPGAGSLRVPPLAELKAPQKQGQAPPLRKVLMLVSTELNRPGGHFLALNVRHGRIAAIRADRKTDIQTAINEVNADGGFVIIAHPLSEQQPWKDWGLTGVTGMEVVSLGAMLTRHQKEIQDRAMLGIFTLTSLNILDWIRPSIESRPDADLAKWDEVTSHRRFVGIGSVDSHARARFGKMTFDLPPYRDEFNAIRTHIFTRERFNGDVAHDAALVYGALKAGHCAVGYRIMADATGFLFTAKGNGAEAIMGDEITLGDGLVLEAHAPLRSEAQRLVLVKDGSPILTTDGAGLRRPVTERGVYRIEAYMPVSHGWFQKSVPAMWVLSNPIYVRKEVRGQRLEVRNGK